MRVYTIWRNFWFREAPYFDLAFLRIAIVSLQCFLMLSKGFGELTYVLGLNDLLYQPLPIFKLFMLPWGLHARPDHEVTMLIFTLTLAFGAAALMGLATNISLTLFAAGNLFIQSYIYSFGDFHHPEAILLIALLVFALSPCGKVLSIDSWIQSRRLSGISSNQMMLDYKGSFAGWPVKLIQLFFPLMYLSAITAKLGIAGFDWANGYTLQYYFIHDSLRKGGLPLALELSQYHDALAVAQAVVVMFQATFFLVIPFPKLRWIYLPIGLGFHFGNYFILEADFPQWILLYGVFIPWSQLIRWLATTRVSATPVVMAGK